MSITRRERERREPGRVTEVFDDGRVIVSMGRDAGVIEGTRLAVVRDYDEVIEPTTGEVLGRIMNLKVELSVYSADALFSVTYMARPFVDTLRAALPFLSADRTRQPAVGDEVVFAEDWDV